MWNIIRHRDWLNEDYRRMKKVLFICLIACFSGALHAQDDNVIDEIVWVVGDDAILRSDVERQRLVLQNEGQHLDGDPYCVIPEQMAIQKLYLNQAKIDSIEANESQVIQEADRWVNFAINQIGSKEKLEEYFNMKVSQIKEERKEMIMEQQIVQQMQRKLIGDIKLTPSEVRKYYNQLPKDSLPMIPTSVEVQIITMEPKIPFEETDAIKARLRQFTEDINTGKYEFSTLARLYSEDPGSSSRGGELGFLSKMDLLPEFANVAFNLKDTKKISQIVQTEYGFHIIQLIERRGDRINCRHILLKPKVSDKELNDCMVRMDSLYTDLAADKFSFEEAATWVSADKDTRYNKGLMVNTRSAGNNNGTPRFEMGELPQEIGKIVYTMNVGEISKPFRMISDKQQEVVAIVKLKARIDQHQANLSDDYQALKTMVESKKREQLLNDWIAKKQKTTYVRISEGWRNCDFKYPGWMNE